MKLNELNDFDFSEELVFDDDDDFHRNFGVLYYNDDDIVDEAEYQGRKVKLGKPMAGDVKKFKVYVKNPKGNVVKVNFGQKGTKPTCSHNGIPHHGTCSHTLGHHWHAI